MDKFEENEMMKKRPSSKSTWYNWFNLIINYTSKTIKNGGWC